MPPKRDPNGRPKDAIHFVNARPSSDAERLNIKRMVRAHVGKWISTQTKDKGGPAGAGAGAGADPESESAGSGSGSAAGVPGQGPPLVHVRPVTRDGDADGHTGDAPSSANAQNYTFEIESEDPFHPLASTSNSGSASSTLSPVSSRDSPASTASSSSHASHTSGQVRSTSHELTVALVPARNLGSAATADTNTRCGGQEGYSGDSPDSDSSIASGEYIESIGAGRLDPFRVYAGQYEPELVRTSEEYCLSCLWPGLAPDPSGMNMRSWFPMSLHDPTLFTAFLFGSLSHMRVQALNGWIPAHMFSAKQQRMLESVEMETVEMVNREIQNPSRATCDSIIFSVVCMAHSQMDRSLTELQNIPFTSPMQRLQWLDVYGSLPPNLVHVGGLVQMVKLRGGIDKIQLPGLASIISFSDLVASTAFLCRPTFPFVPLVDRRRDYTMQEFLGYATHNIDHFDTYFHPLGLPRIFAELICAMNTYTSLVDGVLNNQMRLDTPLLADQRNIIHYTLLCIPGIPTPDQSSNATVSSHDILYETFRLATLIYSVGVILPLPAQSTPLPKLASQLYLTLAYSTLHHPTFWENPNPHSQIILLWILTLGAIAATNTPLRAWFVERLARTVVQNKISGFEDLKRCLGLVAWYAFACDTPGIRLWREIQEGGVFYG